VIHLKGGQRPLRKKIVKKVTVKGLCKVLLERWRNFLMHIRRGEEKKSLKTHSPLTKKEIPTASGSGSGVLEPD